MSLSQHLSWGCNQGVDQGYLSRLDWGKIHFQFPSKLTQMSAERPWALSGCWPEVSVPYYVGLSIVQPPTWQLASLRVSKQKIERAFKTEAIIFCNLISEVTSVTSASGRGGDYTRVWIRGGEGHGSHFRGCLPHLLCTGHYSKCSRFSSELRQTKAFFLNTFKLAGDRQKQVNRRSFKNMVCAMKIIK